MEDERKVINSTSMFCSFGVTMNVLCNLITPLVDILFYIIVCIQFVLISVNFVSFQSFIHSMRHPSRQSILHVNIKLHSSSTLTALLSIIL